MNYLILLRHGQSQWNLENRFTGLTDVPLTISGEKEAKEAGNLINKLSIPIDIIYSSALKRANDTAIIAIKQTNQDHLYKNGKLSFIKDPALNERDYGNLVGLNKLETAKKYGDQQVHIWRRSYDIAPPGGESLKNVVERVEPFYKENIKENIKENKNILIVAHGNSLRALLICLKLYKSQEISKIEIPTGKPFVMSFKDSKLIDYRNIH